MTERDALLAEAAQLLSELLLLFGAAALDDSAVDELWANTETLLDEVQSLALEEDG